MRTTNFDPRAAHFIRDWPSWLSTKRSFSVSVFKSMQADRSRILQALTEPEYIETWLSPPGALPGCTSASPWRGSLLIGWSSLDGGQFWLVCTYKVRRRSKLLFTWTSNTGSEVTPSLVRIQLHGDFGKTITHLTHVGLAQSDLPYYEDLWQTSLEKLSKLFAAGSSSRFNSKAFNS
jgi:uncharacterized protein YndB with AHSA1/START domain